MQIDASVRLSDNFTLAELTVTGGRPAYEGEVLAWGFANKDKLEKVASTLLQPVRNYFKLPMIVTSGARTLGLNSQISGASATTQHVLCEAADFFVKGMETAGQAEEIVEWIGYSSGIAFGQVIHETRTRKDGTTAIWTHISLGAPWRAANLCGQVLRYHDGVYERFK